MDAIMRNILKGAGSVFCLWPHGDYTRFIPASPEEQIYEAWADVGHSLEKAIGQFEDEQKTAESEVP
ncbi:MAG: hypothetical protein HW380_2424 [Magnetococcales bacterium]|nr:hypothetical protein [Magnetococcales bacterium]